MCRVTRDVDLGRGYTCIVLIVFAVAVEYDLQWQGVRSMTKLKDGEQSVRDPIPTVGIRHKVRLSTLTGVRTDVVWVSVIDAAGSALGKSTKPRYVGGCGIE